MTIRRATGADDPALAETSWPLPCNSRVEWKLQCAESAEPLTVVERGEILVELLAYRSLICDGTTKQQLARLAALRRVYRKRPLWEP